MGMRLLNPSSKGNGPFRNRSGEDAFQVYVKSLSKNGLYIYDNFGRRSGLDRRRKVISKIKVERRKQAERRKNIDRRSGIDRRVIDLNDQKISDRRRGIDQREFVIVDIE
jgi:hypothetical protein